MTATLTAPPAVDDAEVLAFARAWGAATTGPDRWRIADALRARLAPLPPFDRISAMCLFRAHRWPTP